MRTSRSRPTAESSSRALAARERSGCGTSRKGKQLLLLDQQARDPAPVHAVIGIDVSPDGSRIATAGADGSVRIFDVNTGKELLALRHRHCVPHGLCVVNRAVFSPDGSKIATTGWDATVRILERRQRPSTPRPPWTQAPCARNVRRRVESRRETAALDRPRRNAHLGRTHRPSSARASAPAAGRASRARGAPTTKRC
jgi:hypothetical protein